MKEQTKTFLVACGLAVLAAVLSFGTAAAQAASKAPLPALSESIDVRVVNLEAVVTDDGIPVRGLGAGDFRLEVDGEEMPIEFFSEVRGGVAVAAGGGTTDLRAIPTVAPGEPVGTSYLVFVDNYFPIAQDRDRVLEALRSQLGNLRPEDRMAIVAYGGNRLEMLSTWTNSVPVLERAIREAERWPAEGLYRWSERRTFEVSSGRLNGFRSRRLGSAARAARGDLTPDEYFYGRLLEEQVARVVKAAAASLRGFGAAPGRRVAILLSGGWPFDIPAYVAGEVARPVIDPGFDTPSELFRPLVETANLLGYTLYPVDVPGMQAIAGGDAASALGEPVSSPRGTTWERETQFRYSLELLASETGGKALNDSARLDLLDRIASDAAGSYYWIGFAPNRAGDDSRWKVKLESTRPGVKVRARRSFTDLSLDREVGMAVESALRFGNPPSPQQLVASLSKGERSGLRRMRASLSVEVPSDAIVMLADGDRFVADLELRVAALDRGGASSEVVPIPLTLWTDSATPSKTLRFSTELELRPKTEKLVVSLYDKATGSILMSSIPVVL
jgi:VWFA-related protein